MDLSYSLFIPWKKVASGRAIFWFLFGLFERIFRGSCKLEFWHERFQSGDDILGLARYAGSMVHMDLQRGFHNTPDNNSIKISIKFDSLARRSIHIVAPRIIWVILSVQRLIRTFYYCGGVDVTMTRSRTRTRPSWPARPRVMSWRNGKDSVGCID